ncbi:hypothetical protein NDU88_006484 [Pleurodeles waltl]|uniref:Uncharacterized protein n=1 Tax=Pleurodeles waltl TaxID=8319 RepID=A0AAV7SPZ3_PLEWA|nr:hypothetical protein NDU88_006484 [Pleurodeles waltl]
MELLGQCLRLIYTTSKAMVPTTAYPYSTFCTIQGGGYQEINTKLHALHKQLHQSDIGACHGTSIHVIMKTASQTKTPALQVVRKSGALLKRHPSNPENKKEADAKRQRRCHDGV